MTHWINCIETLFRERLLELRNAETTCSDSAITAFDHCAELPKPVAQMFEQVQANRLEKIILLTALAPHVQPGIFDNVIQQVYNGKIHNPYIGGVTGKHYRGILPTGDTALFIAAGSNENLRKQAIKTFHPNHGYQSENVLFLEDVRPGEPFTSGILTFNPLWLKEVLLQESIPLKTSSNFPAKQVNTNLEWSDLIVADDTKTQLQEIQLWLEHHQHIIEAYQLGKIIRPGFKALFYGPPGTGKTMTATLLGKQFNKAVYKIDLSLIVSKYIGETEKNLENIFRNAENKDWILFFDEADALFGKRTSVKDAHDKYANQEVAYLLQRIESFDGMVILATNYRTNIDKAFTRRFNAVIHFPMPDPEMRKQLWLNAFPNKINFEPSINWEDIATQFEFSGGMIVNAVRHTCLLSLSEGDHLIKYNHLFRSISLELEKEGKTI